METQIGLMRVGTPSQALRAIEQRPVAAAEAPLRVAEDVFAREVAQNARTWAALTRLGVRDGTELRLDFFYETTGAEADHELADFLEQEDTRSRSRPTGSRDAPGRWLSRRRASTTGC